MASPRPSRAWVVGVKGQTYHLEVLTDPNLHSITVPWHNMRAGATPRIMINRVLDGRGPAFTHLMAGSVMVTAAGGGSDMALCRSLVHG